MVNAEYPTRWHSLFNPGQFLGSVRIGAVAGISAGLAAGAVARLVMRGIALFSGTPPSFSIQGTLFIIGLGGFLGLWVGILFGFMLPFLPGPVTRKGIFFGLAPSLIFALLIFLVEPEGELALLPRWLTAASIAIIPLFFGAILGQVAARLAPRSVEPPAESLSFARTAGHITIATALAGAILETVLAITHPAILNLGFSTANTLNQLAGGSLVVMAFMGIAGLMRSGAAGGGRGVKFGLSIALATVALLGMVSVYEGLDSIQLHGLARLMDGDDSLYSDWLLLAPLLLAVMGLLAAGLAVMRLRRWSAWRAFTPLLVGFYPLLSILFLHPSLIPALLKPVNLSQLGMGYWLGALFCLCWLVLGVALRVESSPPALSGNQILEPGIAR